MKTELLHTYLDQRIDELDIEEKQFLKDCKFYQAESCSKAKCELIDVKRFVTANQRKTLTDHIKTQK